MILQKEEQTLFQKIDDAIDTLLNANGDIDLTLSTLKQLIEQHKGTIAEIAFKYAYTEILFRKDEMG